MRSFVSCTYMYAFKQFNPIWKEFCQGETYNLRFSPLQVCSKYWINKSTTQTIVTPYVATVSYSRRVRFLLFPLGDIKVW